MTILGAPVLAPDLAVAWVDAELFDERSRRVGFVGKLAVNPAGFAFTLAGWNAAATAGADCVVQAADLGTAPRRLPSVLRQASEKAAAGSHRPVLHAGTHAALMGWDAAGGMVAYRFTAAECSVPMLDDAQTMPRPAVDTGTRPDGPAGIAILAAPQVLHLRGELPHAIGGPVQTAVIRPKSVMCLWAYDLREAVTVHAMA